MSKTMLKSGFLLITSVSSDVPGLPVCNFCTSSPVLGHACQEAASPPVSWVPVLPPESGTLFIFLLRLLCLIFYLIYCAPDESR